MRENTKKQKWKKNDSSLLEQWKEAKNVERREKSTIDRLLPLYTPCVCVCVWRSEREYILFLVQLVISTIDPLLCTLCEKSKDCFACLRVQMSTATMITTLELKSKNKNSIFPSLYFNWSTDLTRVNIIQLSMQCGRGGHVGRRVKDLCSNWIVYCISCVSLSLHSRSLLTHWRGEDAKQCLLFVFFLFVLFFFLFPRLSFPLHLAVIFMLTCGGKVKPHRHWSSITQADWRGYMARTVCGHPSR